MYNFLVVEDEQHVRETVVAILKELNGDNQVYSAENGLEALKVIEQVHIDAMITDIKMPMKSGLELIRDLYKRRRKPLVVILSGFDEFEYLQTAMSYGAVDYILKPVKRSEIVKLYFKLVRRLQSRKTLENELEEVNSRLDEIKPYIRQRCYSDLISGRLNETAFENIRSFLGLHIQNKPIRIVLLEIDENESGFAHGSGEDSLSLYKLIEIIEGIVSEEDDCDFFSLSNNTAAIIWCPEGNVRDTRKLTKYLELLSDELAEAYKVVLNIGISEPMDSPLEAGRADMSAREAIHYKLLYGSGQIFAAETVRNKAGTGISFDTGAIVEQIWLNDQEKAKSLVKQFADEIRLSQGQYRLTSIQLLCQKLLVDCLMILEKECEDLDNWYQRKGYGILTTNFRNYSVDAVESFFQNLVTDICVEIGRTRKDDRKKAVDMARQMISRQYASNLSIEKIARELHYSRNYFGQLFKSETGMSVSEYINQVRVQKAKELLFSGEYRIGQIAEKVGFSDQQYFTRVFKKIVGCMPSEYVP